jgi:hypothetical protein
LCRLGETGEVGEVATSTTVNIGIVESRLNDWDTEGPDFDVRVEEKGFLKLNPNPMTSCFSSPFCSSPGLSSASSVRLTESLTPPLLSPSVETVAMLSTSLIWYASELDVFTALALVPSNGEHSFLTEETKVGKGICVGEGVQYLPGGAIRSGFGGEADFAVAETLRGGLALADTNNSSVAETLRCRAGCSGEDGLGVVDTSRCRVDCGVAKGFRGVNRGGEEDGFCVIETFRSSLDFDVAVSLCGLLTA